MSFEPPDAITLPPEVLASLDEEPDTEALVFGKPGGVPRVGWVIKRTYRVADDGHCELADDADQELVVDGFLLYEELEAPGVSPIAWHDDLSAFRQATDLVIQGSAQSYGQVIDRTLVAVGCGEFRREIQVYGDRRVEWKDGELRFTTPEVFETLPVRYDRAYGGFDATAIERFRDPEIEELARARPEWELERATPFHYERNPSGRGFLVRADAESAAAVLVPNLEFPFDPVTPDRIAVGEPGSWLRGPLPAAMDWIGPDWFPRCAYIGLTLAPKDWDGPVAEVDLGWAAPDLLGAPSVLQQPDAMRSEFSQGASPGMSFASFDPAAELVLENLHPRHPSWRVRLPGEVPDARLELAPGQLFSLAAQLNSVVVRPDDDTVVMTWCASGRAPREPTALEAQSFARELRWRRKLGGV